MKRILVAIDFSESSHNTLDHAASLASKFRSKLLLLWVENPKSLKHLNYCGERALEEVVEDKISRINFIGY